MLVKRKTVPCCWVSLVFHFSFISRWNISLSYPCNLKLSLQVQSFMFIYAFGTAVKRFFKKAVFLFASKRLKTCPHSSSWLRAFWGLEAQLPTLLQCGSDMGIIPTGFLKSYRCCFKVSHKQYCKLVRVYIQQKNGHSSLYLICSVRSRSYTQFFFIPWTGSQRII